jgi:hypothetical protein
MKREAVRRNVFFNSLDLLFKDINEAGRYVPSADDVVHLDVSFENHRFCSDYIKKFL